MKDKILVTGAAGFIGFHVCEKLLNKDISVVGYDNLNDYYSVELKKDRLKLLKKNKNFKFVKGNLENRKQMKDLFDSERPKIVINLAAQAGVRYSLKHPHDYIDSNLVGFLNILEGCRNTDVKHLIFASSSSVYGANKDIPFSTDDNVDHPVSLYAATKKSNELMAHSYSYLYDIPVTGLRFFTVYGPWGRPDMALFIFTRNILKGKPIRIFNNGDMRRDFTYVDDVVEGIFKLIDHPPKNNSELNKQNLISNSSVAPYKIYNIGNNNPVELMNFVKAVESELGIEAKKEFEPMQPGDVKETYADVSNLKNEIDYTPDTPISEGVKRFIDWYKKYYNID